MGGHRRPQSSGCVPCLVPVLGLCPLPCRPRAGTLLPSPQTPKGAALPRKEPRDRLCPSSSSRGGSGLCGEAGHVAVGSTGLQPRVVCLGPTRGLILLSLVSQKLSVRPTCVSSASLLQSEMLFSSTLLMLTSPNLFSKHPNSCS